MSEDIVFIKGEIFHKEENQYIEFKREVDSNKKDIVNGIVDYSERYILGFLNAMVKGELYLGIDDSGEVSGINLSREGRDDLNKKISDKLRNANPTVPMSCYKVEALEVFDPSGEIINDLNVIRISVLQADEEEFLYKATKSGTWFYKTDKDETYYKTSGTCIRLSSEEIAAEIRKRTLKYLQKEADKLDKELIKDPKNTGLLEKRINNAKNMGDAHTLDDLYKRLMEVKDNPQIKERQAKAHRDLGDLKGAEDIINEVIQSGVSSSSSLKIRGDILKDLKRWNEAYQSYEQAYNQNPNDYTILTKMGIILRDLGRHQESIQCFNEVLKKFPQYRFAKYEKRLTYYEMFKRGV